MTQRKNVAKKADSKRQAKKKSIDLPRKKIVIPKKNGGKNPVKRKGSRQTEKGRLVEQYCKDWPHIGTRTLTSKLLYDHPLVFSTFDSTRTLVRIYRDELKSGKGVHKDRITRRSDSPIFIPESHSEQEEDFILPIGKWGILTDIHFPYHNEQALDVSLNYLLKNGFRKIVLNGDTLDMYQASRFLKNPNRPTILEEFEIGRMFLESLSKHFDEIVYKIGNHDERWENYLIIKAPELFNDDEYHLSGRLRFGEYHVKQVNSKQLVRAGKLCILHGHELPLFSGGVNPARSIFLKGYESLAVGHFHRTSSHTERTLLDSIIATHSIGSLCQLKPKYAPFNNWNNGFATHEFDSSGEYDFSNLRIVKGKIY